MNRKATSAVDFVMSGYLYKRRRGRRIESKDQRQSTKEKVLTLYVFEVIFFSYYVKKKMNWKTIQFINIFYFYLFCYAFMLQLIKQVIMSKATWVNTKHSSQMISLWSVKEYIKKNYLELNWKKKLTCLCKKKRKKKHLTTINEAFIFLWRSAGPQKYEPYWMVLEHEWPD